MKIKSLTPKQEKFAQLVVSGKSLSDAYRGAFAVKERTALKTINDNASQLMARTGVAQRVDSLRVEHMSRVAEEVTYEYKDAMRELDEVIKFARERNNPSALVAALSLKQKISGLHVEDRKNDRNPVAGMSSDRVKAALEALQVMRMAKAGGR